MCLGYKSFQTFPFSPAVSVWLIFLKGPGSPCRRKTSHGQKANLNTNLLTGEDSFTSYMHLLAAPIYTKRLESQTLKTRHFQIPILSLALGPLLNHNRSTLPKDKNGGTAQQLQSENELLQLAWTFPGVLESRFNDVGTAFSNDKKNLIELTGFTCLLLFSSCFSVFFLDNYPWKVFFFVPIKTQAGRAWIPQHWRPLQSHPARPTTWRPYYFWCTLRIQ